MKDTQKQAKGVVLCNQCRCIDFKKVLNLNADALQASGRNGSLIAEFSEKPSFDNPTTCVLCQILSVVKSSCVSSPQELQLRAFSTFSFTKGHLKSMQWKRLPKTLLAADLPHLALVSSDFASRPTWQSDTEFFFCVQESEEDHRIFQPRTLSYEFDYTSVIANLKFCKSKHKFLCGREDVTIRPSRLIDCHASPPSVVHSPSCTPYVALSYVWGKNGSQGTPQNTYQGGASDSLSILPLDLPKTISDAQIVVNKLGYRYLWVDQVCIDQNDPSDKRTQISIMDKIYGGADLTIVAAAGVDSYHGLPGVSSTLRRKMPKAELHGIHIIGVPCHPHHFIKSSNWASRAWTYQEALLSKRLLFFTEYETYFECHSMQARECMNWDHEALHCKQGKLYSFFNSGLFLRGISNNDSYIRTPITGLIRYYDLISEYTARQMTYEEDSLRAFVGITKHLERCKVPVFQLQGIPFLPDQVAHEISKSLLASLLWIHMENFRYTLPPRRSEFPSWSWAGWKGQVKFVTDSQAVYTRFNPQATFTGIILHDGAVLGLSSLYSDSMGLAGLEAHAIRLRASMLVGDSFSLRFTAYMPNCRVISKLNPPMRPAQFNRLQPVPPSRLGRRPTLPKWYPGFKARLFIYERPKILTKFAEFFESKRFKALLMGYIPRFSSRKSAGIIYFLIVEPFGNAFRRMGVLEVTEDFKTFSKDVTFEERSFVIY